MAKLILRLMLHLIVCYLVVAALMYFKQRSLQYFPGKESSGAPADSGVPEMKAVQVTTADGLGLYAWFGPPKDRHGKIIVIFHGNAGNLKDRAYKARFFLDRGYGVYLCEYRAFGGNPGAVSEEGFYNDGRAGIKWLEAQGYSKEQFVIYGESIGSGVATQIALEVQPREMVIEAGFSSAADVAKSRYFFLPVDLLLKDRYDNADKIGRIKTSLFEVHGDADEVIPYRFGQKLYNAANQPKHFMTVSGGHHNDLYNFGIGPVIVDWLDGEVKKEHEPETGAGAAETKHE